MIKDNHLENILSAAMNLSAITLFVNNIEHLIMNSRIEVAKFEPELTFEKTVNNNKDNHLKSIMSIAMNLSAITSNKPYLYSEHLKPDLVPWILLQLPGKSPQYTNHFPSMYPKGNTQLKVRIWWFSFRSEIYQYCFVRTLFIPLDNQHHMSYKEKTQKDS